MHLISCSRCGVVYDADQIPLVSKNEDGSYPDESSYSGWDGEFYPTYKCQVCDNRIDLPLSHWSK